MENTKGAQFLTTSIKTLKLWDALRNNKYLNLRLPL